MLSAFVTVTSLFFTWGLIPYGIMFPTIFTITLERSAASTAAYAVISPFALGAGRVRLTVPTRCRKIPLPDSHNSRHR
jgi:sulfite exporter TauE/SafE